MGVVKGINMDEKDWLNVARLARTLELAGFSGSTSEAMRYLVREFFRRQPDLLTIVLSEDIKNGRKQI